MSRIAFPFAATLALCLALLAAGSTPAGVGVKVSAAANPHTPSPPSTAEVARLRDHFRTVIGELESADVSD